MFEAVGACAAGTITENELGEIEKRACPTEGSCAGMFTANTMSSIAEAIGMALPGSASPPAVDRRRDDYAYESGRAVMHLLELDLRPRQIMTKEAFENAIAITMALGGSTNAVLHLLAIANEARVELELDDFNRVGARVAHLADMKPHGKYHMADLDRVGGVQVVMKELLDAGLLHGDCLTVTGKTIAENLDRPRAARARRRSRAPAVESGARAGWYRDPAGLARAEGRGREGRRSRSDALRGPGPRVRRRRSRDGRDPRGARSNPATSSSSATRDPKGGPGMREMLAVTGAMKGVGRGADCRARSPTVGSRAGTHGFCVGHVAPEAVDGGPIAFVAEGDRIVIDADTHTIDLLVDDAEIAKRKANWKLPEPRYTSGFLAKYAASRPRGRDGRDHQHLSSEHLACRKFWKSKRRGRCSKRTRSIVRSSRCTHPIRGS